jgi:hypothetical protein
MSQPKQGLDVVESGTVYLCSSTTELLQVNFESSKVINVVLENKKFLKGLIKMGRAFAKKQQKPKAEGQAEGKKGPSPLATARTVAETLKKNGVTLKVSYQGGVVATLGEQAHPKMLQLITKTRAIALNSPLRAIRMLV